MSFPNPFTLPKVSNDQGAAIIQSIQQGAQSIFGQHPGQGQSPGQGCPFGQLLTPANAAPDTTYTQNLKGTGQQFHDLIAPKTCTLDTLFEAFKAEIAKENAGHPNADQVADLIKQAIQDVVKTIQVPDFVLFAMIMQESRGNVYVKSTTDADGKPNGGLLQCEGGAGWNGTDTMGLEQITNDIKAGAQHFKGNLDQAKNDVFQALRLYNSGAVASSGDLSDPKSVGTPSYVADVANKLHGCIGPAGA